MKRFNIKIDYAAHRRFVNSLTILMLSGTVVNYVILPIIIVLNNISGVIIDFTVTPSLIYIVLHVNLYILQFVFACLALRERFRLLNDHLE